MTWMVDMIRIVPGVRPIRNTSLVSANRGFSLIEVMMTVVLLGVSLVLALPSFRDMVEKRQITNGAEQLVSFINTAQGVSMKTNQVVTVSWTHSDDDDWCIGAIAGETACDCGQANDEALDYCQIDSRQFILNNTHTDNLDLMHDMAGADDGTYAFDPIRGLFVDLDDSLIMELRSPSEDFRLNLMVNNTGRVSLCSKDSSYAVPGYAVCPSPPVEEESS